MFVRNVRIFLPHCTASSPTVLFLSTAPWTYRFVLKNQDFNCVMISSYVTGNKPVRFKDQPAISAQVSFLRGQYETHKYTMWQNADS